MQAFAEEQEIAIADDVLTGGAEVDDGACVGCGIAKGVNVGHDIVAEFGFVLLCGGKVDVVEVCAEFINLLLGDVQAKFALGFCQGQPDAAPG